LDLLSQIIAGLIEALPATAIVLILFIVLWYEIRMLRYEIRNEIRMVKSDFEHEIGGLRAEYRRELDGLRREISELRNTMLQGFKVLERTYIALISILESRSVLSVGEAIALKSLLTLTPGVSSRFYTHEVARRLKELIDKDPRDLTLDEVRELLKISDLMLEEYRVSGREDLFEYAVRLKVYCALVEGIILRRMAEEALKKEQARSATPQPECSTPS